MFEITVPLWADIAIFLGAAITIWLAGSRTATYADRLADRTGLGEAITGTVFLGLITALPGLVASVVAAMKGHASLAISNALGGIAAQTAALAVADIAYTKANLEHAAASIANMMQAAILVLLITLVLTGMSGPDLAVGHVHPMTIILFLIAGAAFFLVIRTRDAPMWKPTLTAETVEDVPDQQHMTMNLAGLVTRLLIAAAVTAVSGALVAESATNLVEETPLPEAVVGGLFMALATSLPELVTSVAAVRRGALTLAVSDIVGGNFFDVLFVAAADLAYFNGSLYHAEGVGNREVFLAALTIMLNIILLIGLIYRQKSGPGNIGFESMAMLVFYFAGFLILSLAM